MAEVQLPPGIERRCIDTGRGPVAALHARPERAAGRTSVMVCGFMATKEDFRQILPLLARAGHDAWAYDHVGQHGGEPAVGRDDGPERYTIASMAQEGREVSRRSARAGRSTWSATASAASSPGRWRWPRPA
jgi:dienelactone hydrolase